MGKTEYAKLIEPLVSRTIIQGDAHRGAVEWRAHGKMQTVSEGLRENERAWSQAHARARAGPPL